MGNRPELQAILRRSLDEFERDLEGRDPIGQDVPVVADIFNGASRRELADARDDPARASERHEQAIQAARAAGLPWAG